MTVPIATDVRLTEGAPFAVAGSNAAEAVVLAVHPSPDGAGPVIGSGAAELAQLSRLDLPAMLAREGARGAAGEVVSVPVGLDGRVVRCLLVGVGDRSAGAYRRAGAALARKLTGVRGVVLALDPGEEAASGGIGPEEAGGALVEGALLASYRFSFAEPTPGSAPPEEIHLAAGGTADGDVPAGQTPGGGGGVGAAVRRAQVVAGAVAFARDLINTPASTKSPEWLAEQADRVAGAAGLSLRVLAEDELRAAGFGGILAVGAGSARPPRLIELGYSPDEAPDPRPEGAGEREPRGHVVLVGKGITFDSGGLSLKSSDGMTLMKTDMAGGGVVMAVLSALRELGVPCRVTGLVAAAENMPSGSAQRPGDVITQYGGRTTEVRNTDAEGRLVLADALTYASQQLAPDALVDLATLTGAATVALGRTHAALYATDDALAAGLVEAGEATGDQLWRMPLYRDYRRALDSDVADLSHIADPSHGGGSVLAALFLNEFATVQRWAHVDMAGPARAGADERELTKGATGFGVRALLYWLSAGPPPGR